jgi:predicted RNA-binding protein YlqC (UPF0109 family)
MGNHARDFSVEGRSSAVHGSTERMKERVKKLASSLKQLGEIQVNDWDFMALLNTEIHELEIAHSLRRLGQIQVTDWDFRSVIPAVKKTANHEVDVVNLLKRTANYKVMEWDFRAPTSPKVEPARVDPKLGEAAAVEAVSLKLRSFLQFVAVNLIDEPDLAQIRVLPLGPTGLRFKLLLTKKDTAKLIGKEGHTAAAIRGILQATAAIHGVQALLQIHSHEEENAQLARLKI